ncbi:MAG: preprotein translocase subunit SecA [bacterium]
MQWLIKKIVGTKNQRDVKKMQPLVARINEFEQQCQSFTEEQLKAKTQEFRDRLARGQTLDDILCEAFAVVKNACRRLCGTRFEVCGHELTWEMVPFDTQLMGGMALHHGKIAEMATGEGKTLVATLPLYLNALGGGNVHLVTVNDYLARRDSQWMGLVFQYLGLSVGCIQNQMNSEERRAEYSKDITYGTNSEFGFDYLRDNGMAWRAEDQVQRGHFYAIVDEIDSILIDEARTPLIISGPAPVSSHQYFEVKPRVERLVRRQSELCSTMIIEARTAIEAKNDDLAMQKLYQVHHGMPKHKQLMHLLEEPSVRRLLEKVEGMMLTDMYKEQARALREELFFNIDEKGHDATLTEKGCEEMSPSDPDAYVLPDLVSVMSDIDGDASLSETDRAKKKLEFQERVAQRSERIHNVDQLIRAYCLYEKDVQYVVQDNQVLIVDEYTGRILPGRRWSDGLHQAVEAKEGVKIERETQTLATITIQNYFRMYKKLAGMTGTAETEADEFHQIYKLDVTVIPTNRPVRRVDNNDVVYKTQREKFKAIVDEIAECHTRAQPVLVGTISVETSELLSRMLNRAKIPHSVLNAKNHEREADIVARAGQKGAVTIATNMAGRGTDIKLGEGVIWVPRDVIQSQLTLGDKLNGSSLKEQLREKPCGLYVIGSERHESRRIDRQLRGRCARQGDPGMSRFYVSLEDDLMRLFGSERIASFMEKFGMEEGEMLEHRMLNHSIETAQRRVEQQNFSIRKRTLEYDDVMNKQRTIIYTFRGDIVRGVNTREQLYDVIYDVLSSHVEAMLQGGKEDASEAFLIWVHSTFPIAVKREELSLGKDDLDKVTDLIFDKVRDVYEQKVAAEGGDLMQNVERQVMLQAIDLHWQDYLRGIDGLRQGIGMRAYGQRDPLIEYKREAYDMFATLMDDIREDICEKIFRASAQILAFERMMRQMPTQTIHDGVAVLGQSGESTTLAGKPTVRGGDAAMQAALKAASVPVQRTTAKVGRNDPCPCGSGKKYKKCCGENA